MYMTGLQCNINWSRPLHRQAIFNVTVTTIFTNAYWISLILSLYSREIVWPSNMKYLAWLLHRTITYTIDVECTLLSRLPPYIYFCFASHKDSVDVCTLSVHIHVIHSQHLLALKLVLQTRTVHRALCTKHHTRPHLPQVLHWTLMSSSHLSYTYCTVLYCAIL